MLDKVKRLPPAKRLRILSISLIVIAALLFISTLTSLSLTASNLMITNQLNTPQQLQLLNRDHSFYLVSQRMVVAFNVLSILCIPFLVFSVFKFYTKGNLIIIIITAVIAIMCWVSSIMFVSGQSQLRTGWLRLWEATDFGNGQQCQIQSCGQEMINYVTCGKLQLWNQTRNCLLGYSILAVPLYVGFLLLAYWTNRLDMRIIDFTEQANTD